MAVCAGVFASESVSRCIKMLLKASGVESSVVCFLLRGFNSLSNMLSLENQRNSTKIWRKTYREHSNPKRLLRVMSMSESCSTFLADP